MNSNKPLFNPITFQNIDKARNVLSNLKKTGSPQNSIDELQYKIRDYYAYVENTTDYWEHKC